MLMWCCIWPWFGGVVAAQAEKVYDQDQYFRKTVSYVGEPMTHIESICSSAVRAAEKVRASTIVVFTSVHAALAPLPAAERLRPQVHGQLPAWLPR